MTALNFIKEILGWTEPTKPEPLENKEVIEDTVGNETMGWGGSTSPYGNSYSAPTGFYCQCCGRALNSPYNTPSASSCWPEYPLPSQAYRPGKRKSKATKPRKR